jgi:hypothetical protein
MASRKDVIKILCISCMCVKMFITAGVLVTLVDKKQQQLNARLGTTKVQSEVIDNTRYFYTECESNDGSGRKVMVLEGTIDCTDPYRPVETVYSPTVMLYE